MCIPNEEEARGEEREWPSKFNFREMRKVSVQEKYRHVNEDVSQAFELFWFGTHERENEFIAYLYSYTICVARIFI